MKSLRSVDIDWDDNEFSWRGGCDCDGDGATVDEVLKSPKFPPAVVAVVNDHIVSRDDIDKLFI